MKLTAEQIAKIINGTIEGNATQIAEKLVKIEQLENNSLAFMADPKFEKHLFGKHTAIVIVKNDFIPSQKTASTLLRVANPHLAFVRLLQYYDSTKEQKIGVSKQAFIAKTAHIGRNVYIGEGAFVGENASIADDVKIYPQTYIADNVSIGENTIVYQGAKIYADCVIGNDCILHAGCVIGADGFGFLPDENGVYEKIPQLGNVVIEENVEIGANSCIDRATIGSTIIKKGVKIDNLTQIAHNCEVGENTVMAACCGIAGSVSIGKNCVFAGQVGVKDHVKIGNFVIAGSQCGIHKNIADNQVVLGSPAIDAKKMMRIFAAQNFLPDLVRERK
ncbi:MAG: UDP-3-O-(3-hydroxymyristoyl)glucosamine N-acyltransferase [Bacteroidales bacterium]|jgi:UDP-3-O-[3-hydroxymyristoyl] glucosamine N-acyltransferase|nr:UDP-3-O-(3-hydroxymyristoyl)glucosamine N-acyltransferase [Bacteroidales bacterium]